MINQEYINSQLIRDEKRPVRVVSGAVFEEVLGDLFGIDNDDVFSQKLGIHEISCMNSKLRSPHSCNVKREKTVYLPYVFAHSVYVNHGAWVLIPITLPTKGSPGGPGGSGQSSNGVSCVSRYRRTRSSTNFAPSTSAHAPTQENVDMVWLLGSDALRHRL